MNNEPVAWMSMEFDEDGDKLTMLSTYNDPLNTKQIPLYTHPAKTLTDGEIVKIFQTTGFWQYSDLVHETDAIEFARAILQRASEK